VFGIHMELSTLGIVSAVLAAIGTATWALIHALH
jgi:hypothetical protein